MTPDELRPVQFSEIPGTFPRVHGSPFWTTRIRDLRGVKHRPFLDATATHLNREPADIARYAAAVMYAGIPSSFGTYDTFPKAAPRPLYHVEDDVLFALALFLYSLGSTRTTCPPAGRAPASRSAPFQAMNTASICRTNTSGL